MEVHFLAPGNLVSNLDFVESIFGNGGDLESLPIVVAVVLVGPAHALGALLFGGVVPVWQADFLFLSG